LYMEWGTQKGEAWAPLGIKRVINISRRAKGKEERWAPSSASIAVRVIVYYDRNRS